MQLSRRMLLLGLLCLPLGMAQASPEEGVALWHAGQKAEAIEHWRPLAEQGDSLAMLYLGFAYRTGEGVQRDNQQAFRWYKAAAEAGVPEAQLELSLMYELGVGTTPDANEAAGWYSLGTLEYCPRELQAGGALGKR